MAKNLNRERVSDIYLTPSIDKLPTKNTFALHDFEIKIAPEQLKEARKHIRTGFNLFGQPGSFGHEPTSITIPKGIYEIKYVEDYDYSDHVLTPNIAIRVVCEITSQDNPGAIHSRGYNSSFFIFSAKPENADPNKPSIALEISDGFNNPKIIPKKLPDDPIKRMIANLVYLDTDLILSVLDHDNADSLHTTWHCGKDPSPISALQLWNARFKKPDLIALKDASDNLLTSSFYFMPQIPNIGFDPKLLNALKDSGKEDGYIPLKITIIKCDADGYAGKMIPFNYIYYSGDKSIYTKIDNSIQNYTNLIGFVKNKEESIEQHDPLNENENFFGVFGKDFRGDINYIGSKKDSFEDMIYGFSITFPADIDDIDERALIFLNNFFRYKVD